MFVNYIFAGESLNLHWDVHCLYGYLVGSNGIFVRADRREFSAMIPVNAFGMRGLEKLQPYLTMRKKVPVVAVARMFEMAYRSQDQEILFYLQLADSWKVSVPEQVQSSAQVHPINDYAGGPETAIEVHSHHHMKAFFSEQDNREESAGFRIYAVIGSLDWRPTILTRIGIYGYFYPIPARTVFDLPEGVMDGFSIR